MTGFVLHFGQQYGFTLQRRGAGNPVAFGQHTHYFTMRVLADLPDQGFAIGIRHPVAGLYLGLRVYLILEYFFEVGNRHTQIYKT